MRFRFDPSVPIVLHGIPSGPEGDIRVRLLLDTGSTTTMPRPPRLRSVGIPQETSETRTITTASGTENIPLIEIESLRVGDITRRHLKVLVHELPPTAEIDGLLGMDFLAGMHLSIRMAQGILTLQPDGIDA